MPYKPKKPCRFAGCAELTTERYCDKHKKQVNKDYEKYKRDPEVYKRYGHRWRKIREEYINAHPLCEECEKSGKLIPAQEVHHIIELDAGGTNDFDNLMALCKSCHSRIGRNLNK
jgi:5-methylcytosine-specific restriction protein A